jgi:hypothetical protein
MTPEKPDPEYVATRAIARDIADLPRKVPRVIHDLYWGKYRLAVAFWGFYVFGALVCLVVGVALMIPFSLLGLAGLGIFFGTLLMWSYWFVATVGVWRSANAYPFTRWWPNVTKLFVVMWTARLLWQLANGGAAALMEKVTASHF